MFLLPTTGLPWLPLHRCQGASPRRQQPQVLCQDALWATQTVLAAQPALQANEALCEQGKQTILTSTGVPTALVVGVDVTTWHQEYVALHNLPGNPSIYLSMGYGQARKGGFFPGVNCSYATLGVDDQHA